jgi:hypothetical protein
MPDHSVGDRYVLLAGQDCVAGARTHHAGARRASRNGGCDEQLRIMAATVAPGGGSGALRRPRRGEWGGPDARRTGWGTSEPRAAGAVNVHSYPDDAVALARQA